MLPTIEITSQHKLELLGALREPLRDYGSGICAKASRNASDDSWPAMRNLLDYIFTQWIEFSGDVDYPVKSYSRSFPCPRSAYNNCSKWEGRYGAARLRLQAFCIQYLEDALT